MGVGNERETSDSLRWTTKLAPPLAAKTTIGYFAGMVGLLVMLAIEISKGAGFARAVSKIVPGRNPLDPR
jgi:hypothetical protein